MRMRKRIGVGMLLVGMAVLGTGCGSKKINLNDYLTYEVKGYDGYGDIDCKLDKNALISDLGDKFKTEEEALFFQIALEKSYKYELTSKEENLSNGDEIKIKWDVDEEALKEKYDIVLKSEDITDTVSGLKKAETYDVFEGTEIEEEGTDGDGRISINTDHAKYGEYYDFYVYTKDESTYSDEISNGDIMIVEAKSNSRDMNDTINQTNGVPEKESYEYTVSNLPAYITDIKQISDKMQQELEEQSKKLITNQLGKGEKEKIEGIEYVGTYLAAFKGEALMKDSNKIFAVNKVKMSTPDGKVSFYSYCEFSDVTLKPDGEYYIDYDDVEYPYYGFFGTAERIEVKGNSDYYYHGFSSLKKFKERILEGLKEDYIITSNVK